MADAFQPDHPESQTFQGSAFGDAAAWQAPGTRDAAFQTTAFQGGVAVPTVAVAGTASAEAAGLPALVAHDPPAPHRRPRRRVDTRELALLDVI